MRAAPRRVFLSYAWESTDHIGWVRQLAARLRADGVDAVLDQWEAVPGDQLPDFMDRAVESSDFVIVICTPTYKTRSDRTHGGVRYEGDVMRAEVLTGKSVARKFIPVHRGGEWAESAPAWLLGKFYIDLSDEPSFEQNYRVLLDTILARRESAPALGDPVQQTLDRADALWTDGKLLSASAEAERAYRLAHDSSREGLAKYALRKAIRAKVQHLSNEFRLSPAGRSELVSEVTKLLTEYAALADSSAHVDLEQSMLSLAMKDGEGAITSARSAYEFLPTDDKYRVDALVSWLQALQFLERESEALELRAEVDRWSSIEDQERILSVELEWLRTVVRASAFTNAHLRHFIDVVDESAARGAVPTAQLIHMLGELAADLERGSQLPACAMVCMRAHALSAERPTSTSHLLQSASIAMQAAEVQAALDDIDACGAALRSAREHINESQLEPCSTEEGRSEWATIYARLLFVHGRCLAEIAFRRLTGRNDIREPEALIDEAGGFFARAHAHVEEHRALIRGDLALFIAELAWWRGRIALAQGRPQEGALLLRDARIPEVLTNTEFARRIGYRAWMAEAEAHFMSGDVAKSLDVASDLLRTHGGRIPDDLAGMARSLVYDVQKRLKPVVEWMRSNDADSLCRESANTSVREVVAAQAEYIVSWYDAWTDKDSLPAAEWLDFWGRGGFARIAAAARGRPHSVVCVDAVSIDEIRYVARVLCPLFDTVLVKWKGSIRPGHVVVPVDIQARDEPGGHGYGMTSSMIGDPAQWFTATAWGNLLPSAVGRLMFTEARGLFREGRLVVLPACLVGCTQLGSGWTDDLLATGFLQGAVSVVRRHPGAAVEPAAGLKRVLDLSQTTIPFVDGVALGDLAAVLRDIDEMLLPLRRVLFGAIANEDLRWERWSAIAALEAEIDEARRFADAKLQEFVRRTDSPWSVEGASQALLAASPDEDASGDATEPMTSMLKALSPSASSPWIPLFALENVGGRLRWTSPLDNRSTPPTPQVLAQLPNAGLPPLSQSWLYPGVRGWGVRLSLRVPWKSADDD